MVFLGGMDNFKEMLVTSPSDKFLERGMAVLAFDGPGQNEARISRNIHCTESNFIAAGKSAMDFLLARGDVDPERIGITGISMGSFWLTQIVAHDHRYKAAAGFYICHEPGQHTLLNVAIPMFKDRYMWMAGFHDEDKFDAFAKTLTLDGLAGKITCPYLSVAGEDDDLSPIEHTYQLHEAMTCPQHAGRLQGRAARRHRQHGRARLHRRLDEGPVRRQAAADRAASSRTAGPGKKSSKRSSERSDRCGRARSTCRG